MNIRNHHNNSTCLFRQVSRTNHGEDVKEYYFYLDSTPTHSYIRYLYKYPQVEYPYNNLSDSALALSAVRCAAFTAAS